MDFLRLHHFKDIEETENGGLLSQGPSIAPRSHFNAVHLKTIDGRGQLLSGNKGKIITNTFGVILEPRLLVAITKAYVPGFYIHKTSIIIWFVHPYG